MRRDITAREEADRLCRLRDDLGFTAFKWRVGTECGHDADHWPGQMVCTKCGTIGADVRPNWRKAQR